MADRAARKSPPAAVAKAVGFLPPPPGVPFVGFRVTMGAGDRVGEGTVGAVASVGRLLVGVGADAHARCLHRSGSTGLDRSG